MEDRPVHSEPSRDAELLRSVRFDVERIRVAPLYRLGIVLAAVAVLLLPLVYLAFIGVLGYGVWYHATHNLGLLRSWGVAYEEILLYVAPLIAGPLAIFFLLKPFLAPAPPGPRPRTLRRDEQPLLYDYVSALADSLGAPRPVRIDADVGANASAGFDGGLSGLLRGNLILMVGLSLTAGTTRSEWTGIVAHELGHFTQATARASFYLVETINGWFARVVYERDVWDERLERWSRDAEFPPVNFVLSTCRFFVWSSRRILWVLMKIGLAVSAFLSRRKEYSADRFMARVSGSESIPATLLRVQFLEVGWQRVVALLEDMWRERRLVRDLPRLVVGDADRLAGTPLADQIRDAVEAAPTHRLDTHPSYSARVRAARQLGSEGIVDDAGPATEIFRDFEGLSEEITLAFYETVLDEKVRSANLISPEEAIEERERREGTYRALDDFCLGSPILWTGVFPPSRGAERPEDAIDTLHAARDAMKDGVEEVRGLIARLDRARQLQTIAGVVLCGRAAGIPEHLVRSDLVGRGVPREDLEEPRARIRSADSEIEDIREALEPHGRSAMDRIQAALVLASETPLPVGPSATDALARAPAILDTLRALAPYRSTLGQMGDLLVQIRYLLERADPALERGPLKTKLLELWTTLRETAEGVRTGLSETPYPYDHADRSVGLGEFLVDELPWFDPSAIDVFYDLLDRLSGLFERIWADLAGLALETEDALGLPRLVPDRAAASEGDGA